MTLSCCILMYCLFVVTCPLSPDWRIVRWQTAPPAIGAREQRLRKKTSLRVLIFDAGKSRKRTIGLSAWPRDSAPPTLWDLVTTCERITRWRMCRLISPQRISTDQCAGSLWCSARKSYCARGDGYSVEMDGW